MKVQNSVKHLVMLLPALFLIGCSDVRLVGLGGAPVNVTSNGDFCTLSPESIKRFTKFLFIMDKSGSNAQSDPGCDRRCGGFQKFYDKNKANPAVQWGMIAFQDPGTRALIKDGATPVFTTDENQVQAAVQELANGDNGGTPYGSALGLAQQAVEKDLKDHADEDNLYMLIFVSDGVPTDGSDENSLRGTVKALVNLSPGKIYLSTGYYDAGGGNGTAENLLKAMADEGMGKYVALKNGDDFDFDELIVGGPSRDPWVIKNMVVYNLNSSICEDGHYGMDSDGDGLCDVDEIKYGFDPTRKFSKPNTGYGDYFQYRKLKFGETLAPCTDRTDEDFDLLTKCEEAHIYNSTPVSPSPDIVVPQRANPKNPDTDLDGIMDGLEVFAFHLNTSPMNARDVLTDYDSEGDAGTQIKQHKNPNVWDPGANAYDTRITPTEIRQETGQTCYHFSQSKLMIYNGTLALPADGNMPYMVHAKGENVVMVAFIQTPQREPLGRGIYNYSFQKLKAPTQAISDTYGDAAGLKVRDGVFQSYIVPKQ
jgi:hypothetical protein